MIQYRFPEEREFILHYAEKLDNAEVVRIIGNGAVRSSEEASALSKFFWDMVDEVVKDEESGVVIHGQKDLKAWNGYVFESIRGYLRTNGYEEEWEACV